MNMVFKFSEGSHLKGDAQAVGIALTAIREARNRLTAPDVVEAAIPRDSPLHSYFEWNNRVAAEQYRLEQSRHLIRSVVVVETGDHGEIRPLRAFAKVSTGQEGSYESIAVVMSDPSMRLKVLTEIRKDIERLKSKLGAFEGFADLLSALNEVGVIAAKIEESQGGVGEERLGVAG